jgi:3-hydroxyacyl-[acyl-carrier-protein] dehydratase
VDRVLEAGPEGVRAVKNVSANEPYFQGHFPGRPIMPGVLIVEAMAQASIFLLEGEMAPGQVALLAGIEGARFRRPVVPGDRLVLESRLEYFRRGLGRANATASVEGELVARAGILFAVPK